MNVSIGYTPDDPDGPVVVVEIPDCFDGHLVQDTGTSTVTCVPDGPLAASGTPGGMESAALGAGLLIVLGIAAVRTKWQRARRGY